MSDYYELWDDVYIPGRWYLRTPENRSGWVNPNLFTGGGGPVELEGPIVVRRREPGTPLDYTMATAGMPVASERAAEVFRRVAPEDTQLIPVTVEGHLDPYFIVQALHAVECLDETRSQGVQRWTEADQRPDMLGDYKAVGVLKVDPARVGDHHFFRVKRWEPALIVSSRLRAELERAELVGLHFKSV